MSKLIMLGTGAGFNKYFYNTCFVINHNNKNFLISNLQKYVIFLLAIHILTIF